MFERGEEGQMNEILLRDGKLSRYGSIHVIEENSDLASFQFAYKTSETPNHLFVVTLKVP